MSGKRVAVGLSGGVDSSVAAYLLQQQGYDVFGLFMINWHDTAGTLYGDCAWKDDLMFAELVAKKLNILLKTVDLSDQYRKRVVDYMFAEYERGRTPNPDILCNREIKFDLFVKAAIDEGAEFVATGHYCRKETIDTSEGQVQRLLAGIDKNKDQSYFLCQLSQQQLSKAIFPIGHLIKNEVRAIAEDQGLATASRKDSQGICFVGKVDLPQFLQQKLQAKRGPIIEISAENKMYNIKPDDGDTVALVKPFSYRPIDGQIIGYHNGAHYYTIGQRKGLNVGGKLFPLFVIGIDVDMNIVYVGQSEEHPGLYRKGLFIPNTDIHWLRSDCPLKPGESKAFSVRIRYRQPLQKATLNCFEEGIYIIFEKPQRSITPGQFAAWYDGEELMGSGVID